jgi:anti-sigma B factor antagonist
MIGESTVVLQDSEYDVYSRPRLQRELDGINGHACVIDFRQVRYMDSTCLGALISALKRMRVHDGNATMTLVHMNPQLRRIFEITNLSQLFSIVED